MAGAGGRGTGVPSRVGKAHLQVGDELRVIKDYRRLKFSGKYIFKKVLYFC